MCSASFLLSPPCSVPWDARIWSDSLAMRNDSAIYKNIVTFTVTFNYDLIRPFLGDLSFFPLPLSCCMFLLHQITLEKNQNSLQYSHPFFNIKQIVSRNFAWQTVSDFSCHGLSWHTPCFHQQLFPSWCHSPVLVSVCCPVVTRSCKRNY